MNKLYAVIMAGGVGTRFWPKSRQTTPKQYLNLIGEKTMIQLSAERLKKLVPKENIFVVSTKEQEPLITSQLDWLEPQQRILEPFGKNTAACIGLAAIHLLNHDADAVMVIMPADHLIRDVKKLVKILRQGTELIEEYPESLVTIGIQPRFPATGYGYIQKGEIIQTNSTTAFKVRAFAEKPSLDIAEKFFSSGEFYWNSGIFIWKAATILDYIEDLMPDLHQGLNTIKAAIGTKKLDAITETVYRQIRSESIDYGVMEQASQVLMIEGDFDWDDVGSWDAVYDIYKKDKNGNVIQGNVISKDIHNSYIQASDRVVAAIGVEDLLIIDTPDALLICKREKSQDVKWVVENLKRSGLKHYL
jgi:mannose-1-phosphate guanylyltransferase